MITHDQRNRYIAREIKNGHCPFGNLKHGQSITHCPLGFPGCGCADELLLNPYLKDKELDIDARKRKDRRDT